MLGRHGISKRSCGFLLDLLVVMNSERLWGSQFWCCDEDAGPAELLECASKAFIPQTSINDGNAISIIQAPVRTSSDKAFLHWSTAVNSAWARSYNYTFISLPHGIFSEKRVDDLPSFARCDAFLRSALQALALTRSDSWILQLEADAIIVDFGSNIALNILSAYTKTGSIEIFIARDLGTQSITNDESSSHVLCTGAVLYRNSAWTLTFFAHLLQESQSGATNACSASVWNAADVGGTERIQFLPAGFLGGALDGPITLDIPAHPVADLARVPSFVKVQIFESAWGGLCNAAESDSFAWLGVADRGSMPANVSYNWGIQLFPIALNSLQGHAHSFNSAMEDNSLLWNKSGCGQLVDIMCSADMVGRMLDGIRRPGAPDALLHALKCGSIFRTKCSMESRSSSEMIASLVLRLSRFGRTAEMEALPSNPFLALIDAPDLETRSVLERSSRAGVLLSLGRHDEAEAQARDVIAQYPHEDSWLLADSQQYLADALWKSGKRVAETEVALRAALAGFEEGLGGRGYKTLMASRHLAVLLKQTRGLEGPESAAAEAEFLLRRPAIGLPLVLGSDHPDAERAIRNFRNLRLLIPVPSPSPPSGCIPENVVDASREHAICPAALCAWDQGYIHFGPNRLEFLLGEDTKAPLSKALHSCAHQALTRFSSLRFLNYWPSEGRCVVKDENFKITKRPIDLNAEGSDSSAEAYTCNFETSTWPDNTSTLTCSLAKDCKWRQTADCSSQGLREPHLDRLCNKTIPVGHSGFCDCNGNDQFDIEEKGFNCSLSPGHCGTICGTLAPLEEEACTLSLRSQGRDVSPEHIFEPAVSLHSRSGSLSFEVKHSKLFFNYTALGPDENEVPGSRGIVSPVSNSSGEPYASLSTGNVDIDLHILGHPVMLPILHAGPLRQMVPDLSMSSFRCEKRVLPIGANTTCTVYILDHTRSPVFVRPSTIDVASPTGHVFLEATSQKRLSTLRFIYRAAAMVAQASISVKLLLGAGRWGGSLSIRATDSGQPKHALPDKQTLAANDDFVALAKIRLHEHRIADALRILTKGIKSLRLSKQQRHAKLKHAEASALRAQIWGVTGQWSKVKGYLGRLKAARLGQQSANWLQNSNLQLKMEVGMSAMAEALAHYAAGSYQLALQHFTHALEVAPESEDLHTWRAECGLALSSYAVVRYDTSSVLSRINKFSTRALYLLALATHRILGRTDAALRNLRICILWDFDNQDCAETIRKLKRTQELWYELQDVSTKSANATAIVSIGLAIIAHDREAKFFILRAHRHLCAAFKAEENPQQAKQYCLLATGSSSTQAAIEEASGNLEEEAALTTAFLNLAWACATLKQWREALSVLDTADRMYHEDADGGEAPADIERMRRWVLDKREGDRRPRDYYEILEIDRNATLDEIKKAYRRLARIWHPDKHAHNKTMSEQAEIIFREIAEAYAALSEEMLRTRYDGGEDVREEARARTSDGFNFRKGPKFSTGDRTDFKVDPKSFGGPDPETGRRKGKAVRVDPTTGEVHTEEVVMEPKFERQHPKESSPLPSPPPPPKRHCCLPLR